MAASEDLIQAARTWIKDTLAITDDSKVIVVQRGAKGPRLPLPYLAVHFTLKDLPVGVDRGTTTSAGLEVQQGNRRGTLRVYGYGPGSDDYIEELGLWSHYAPDPLTVIPMGLSAIQGESFEEAYAKDFIVEYAVRASQSAVVTEIIDLDVEIADQTFNINVELT